MENPVFWAKAFLRTTDNSTKEIGPWTARWYQAETLLDPSKKKVARWGRRLGKTEVMCVDALHKTNTIKHFRVIFVAPFENQIRLAFKRMNELIDESPLVKENLFSRTKNPFEINFKNHSSILGFTTGSSSALGGASIRGQRADHIILDESDYMNDADFDAVLAIASERPDITIFLSSTPTGRRGKFWQCCTDKRLGFKEFYFPSMISPNWGAEMEEDFRRTLSPSGYEHEVLAEFGSQDTGVFNKDKVDAAMNRSLYAYDELTYSQNERVKENKWKVLNYIPSIGQVGIFKPNVFRTMGVDWDKYSASSSIIILDFERETKKFRVIRRIEVPKAEYSLDLAIRTLIKLNALYDPSWIYLDRGYGDVQLEQLHKYGDEHPESGLKTKVKGWQFGQKLEVMDPITKSIEKKPFKPFMVSQLQILFERDQIILSPFDELLHKQLIDYEVVRISAAGEPVFSDKNEHFVDALGLASLAFTLEFPNLTQIIEKPEVDNPIISTVEGDLNKKISNKLFSALKTGVNSIWGKSNLKNGTISYEESLDPREPDGPKYFRTEAPVFMTMRVNWGSRSGSGSFASRRMW